MKKLQEILNLVKETGDKLIVMDPEGDPYVLMNLANYRSLLREESKVSHLSEEELLEKINHLVSAWKSGRPDLADYDLAQFRVDSIRSGPGTRGPESGTTSNEQVQINTAPAPVYEPIVAPIATVSEPVELTPAEQKKARQEELLAQVVTEPEHDRSKDQVEADSLEDEQYYPEPQDETI